MYFRARYYSPQLGQFISRDPLGYVDGMSQYRGYFVPGTVDPFGNEVPGIHHPLSLFLGGSNKQLGIHLDHTRLCIIRCESKGGDTILQRTIDLVS